MSTTLGDNDIVDNQHTLDRPQVEAQTEVWLKDWVSQNPQKHGNLISTSVPQSLLLGAGYEIMTSACQYILDRVEEELIFVTCFWTQSASLLQVCKLLEDLSKKAQSDQKIIRVRIALSSLSLMQKLFHTRSTAGKVYSKNEWYQMLGMPNSLDLSGLDLQIKSVFVTPFSVFHSKFMIIDRKVCLVPSCNVSWETWFEGCVELRGGIVDQFRDYWKETWETGDDKFCFRRSNQALETAVSASPATVLPGSSPLPAEEVKTVFLPSGHHANPQFRPFPWQRCPSFPRTPLNTFTMQLLEGAEKEAFLQTPNTTSPPVLEAIFRALKRGVSVRIITNEKLMRMEQIVTAGTTTGLCLAKLVQSYQGLCMNHIPSGNGDDGGNENHRIGKLRIDYFVPSSAVRAEPGLSPVSSHIKLTVVDKKIVLFGSGNMDRASWYTSQEVGVAVISSEVALRIEGYLMDALTDHLRVYFDSETSF